MAKYKAKFETSGIIMEYEGDSVKTLYDCVKFELRWSLSYITSKPTDDPVETVRIYRVCDWGFDIPIASMYAHNDDYLGKFISMIHCNTWAMIWERPSNKMWEG